MRNKNYERRAKAVSTRLRQVLHETFCGNLRLMAYCADVDPRTIRLWLSGKSLPHDTIDLATIIGVNFLWLDGRSDEKDEADMSLLLKRDYESCYTLAEKACWLKRELVRINALQEKARRQLAMQSAKVASKGEDGIQPARLASVPNGAYDESIERLDYAAERIFATTGIEYGIRGIRVALATSDEEEISFGGNGYVHSSFIDKLIFSLGQEG